MNFITLKNISKSFSLGRRNIDVLKDISFEINEGDFVVLIGASGSGKSTLINLIAGLDKPDAGQIIVDNIEVSSLKNDQTSLWRSDNIGVIFQAYNLLPYMSSLDNVALPLIFHGASRKERIKKAASLLRQVGLRELTKNPAHLLSGGEQQRVTIARALVNDPKILLADEPVGDLDSKNAKDIMEVIYGLYKEKKTIIMATHNHDYVQYADKVIHIEDGKITDKKVVRCEVI